MLHRYLCMMIFRCEF